MTHVILKRDVPTLGAPGDVVNVKPGYARNYLLPQGLALVASKGNVAQLDHHKRAIAAEQARIHTEHEKKATQLRNVKVSVARKKGEGERLFGSVNSKDITDALRDQNIEIDRRLVRIEEPIKTAGKHSVLIRFSSKVEVTLDVNVIGI